MQCWDPVLRWPFALKKTSAFSCLDIAKNAKPPSKKKVVVNINSEYTREIVLVAVASREWCTVLPPSDTPAAAADGEAIYGFCEFELINWEQVVNGKQYASAYVVRKGLSRKAQLALQARRYISKNPSCMLKTAMPFTVTIETWDAFEADVRMDFGMGAVATFDSPGFASQTSLAQKLAWTLEDVKDAMALPERADWLWILKPSVTNKGADIAVIPSWEALLDKLEDVPDIREWVLQKYIPNPLTVEGYKFHIRTYVLCVGALQVYVHEDMLLLLAAHKYDINDLEDDYIHLTNTCRGAEDIEFDENIFVRHTDELPFILHKEHPNKFKTMDDALRQTASIKRDIGQITKEIFEAYENEYTIFSPMGNCFEIFGLDFMVDENFQTSLLEINPGPDFKQTGDSLRQLIVNLWDGICRIVLDEDALANGTSTSDGKARFESTISQMHFAKVYDKELSVSKVKQQMKFS
jgi:tubulin--tyrosine ligase